MHVYIALQNPVWDPIDQPLKHMSIDCETWGRLPTTR
jgi:hypothetical protein